MQLFVERISGVSPQARVSLSKEIIEIIEILRNSLSQPAGIPPEITLQAMGAIAETTNGSEHNALTSCLDGVIAVSMSSEKVCKSEALKVLTILT